LGVVLARRLFDADALLSADLTLGAVAVVKAKSAAGAIDTEVTKRTIEGAITLIGRAAAAFAIAVDTSGAGRALIILGATACPWVIFVYVPVTVVVDAVADLRATLDLVSDADDRRLSLVALANTGGGAPVTVHGATDTQAGEDLVDATITIVVMVITTLGTFSTRTPHAVDADVHSAVVEAGGDFTVATISAEHLTRFRQFLPRAGRGVDVVNDARICKCRRNL
jgi:hypothetical protein